MPTVLFTIPIRKGKIEAYKSFLKECLGPKKNEYKDFHRRYGLKTTKMWMHTLNGQDYAMFIHEMTDDADKLLENWSSPTHPFDQWFNKQLCDCYDVADMDHLPSQPEVFGELDARDMT